MQQSRNSHTESVWHLCCLDSRCEFRSTLDILDRSLFGPLLPSGAGERKHQVISKSLCCVSFVNLWHQVVASSWWVSWPRGPSWGELWQLLQSCAGTCGWAAGDPWWMLWTYGVQGWEDTQVFACLLASTSGDGRQRWCLVCSFPTHQHSHCLSMRSDAVHSQQVKGFFGLVLISWTVTCAHD